MFQYELHNIPENLKDEKKLNKIILALDEIVDEEQKGTINIVFVGEEQIQQLNQLYRMKDKVTDILTFRYVDSFANLEADEIAGEILMCESMIESQAKEKGISVEEEHTHLLIHGFVHMMGYDHETDEEYEQMKEVEVRIAKEIL